MLLLSDIILEQHYLLDEILKNKPLHIFIRIFGEKLLIEDDVVKHYTIIKKYISRSIIERAISDYFPIHLSMLWDHWKDVSCYEILSEDFIRDFQDRLCWESISEHQPLTESFIREFREKVCWYRISRYQKLSEGFIDEHRDKVNWYTISRYQKLSGIFMIKFKNNIDWERIQQHQKLSECFIRYFKNRVNWIYIARYQTLSVNFIIEILQEDKIHENIPRDWYYCEVTEDNSRITFKFLWLHFIYDYQTLSFHFKKELKRILRRTVGKCSKKSYKAFKFKNYFYFESIF